MLLIPVTTSARNSASRVSLAIGYILMVVAPVTLSASGQVFLGAIAAAFGLVPLVLGTTRHKVLGAFPLVIGAAVAVNAYPQFHREIEQYRVRGALAEVVDLGTTIAAALDGRRLSAKSLPKTIDELGVSAPRDKVANVRIESANHFAIVISVPRAAGKELVFVATNKDGPRTWKCMSRGLDRGFRPSACREEFDVSTRPEKK